MSAKRLIRHCWSTLAPLLFLAFYGTVLVATVVTRGLPRPAMLRLAFLYVLSMWIAGGAITLWIYLASSLASFSNLMAAAARASASAVWLLPGALLLASRSSLAIGAGLAAVIGSTALLAARLVPPGVKLKRRRRSRGKTEPLLFRYQSDQRAYLWRQAGPAFIGTLALQAGIYALSSEYPLLAAVSFATATAIWTAMSVARGASEPAVISTKRYSSLRIVLTLLLAVALTAALAQTEIVQEGPGAANIAGIPDLTMSLLQRLAHLPPVPATPPRVAGAANKKQVVTRLVNTGPATAPGAENGVPGVIMRPRVKLSPRPPPIKPRAGTRIAPAEPLALPFTGEYHLFLASSGGLPEGAVVETGTPLEHVYVMNNGGPMETVAVQTLESPIDLSLWSKVMITLTSAETTPVLASMQLVAEESVEDGGTQLMGMTPDRRQVLEFQVPFTPGPLLVHAIWISFLRPGPDRDKNVQLAVEQLTLVPR